MDGVGVSALLMQLACFIGTCYVRSRFNTSTSDRLVWSGLAYDLVDLICLMMTVLGEQLLDVSCSDTQIFHKLSFKRHIIVYCIRPSFRTPGDFFCDSPSGSSHRLNRISFPNTIPLMS